MTLGGCRVVPIKIHDRQARRQVVFQDSSELGDVKGPKVVLDIGDVELEPGRALGQRMVHDTRLAALGAQVVEDTLPDAFEEPALFGATVDARNARRLAATAAG